MVRVAIFIVAALLSTTGYAQDLWEAVQASNVDRVRELLDSGADPNLEVENELTPICIADNLQIVDLLIAHGARLDLPVASWNQTPMEHAAKSWFDDVERRDTWKTIIEKLRAAGAEYTIVTAIYLNDIKYVDELLAKDDSQVNQFEGSESLSLELAARTGRLEICKLLLDHKANVDSDKYGFPIIVDAVEHPAIVKLLIERGANLRRRITWSGGSGNWIIKDEATALHFAVRAGNLETVKILVNAGLDPTATDTEGQTPLHIAVKFERWRDQQKWRNQQQGDTSAFEGIIAYLIQNDASRLFKNREGQTPLELAKDLNSPKEIQKLLRYW
jgi:ankyrin repeat protein